MFAVPIDNTGLASFVPVRRQSGSSVGLQNLIERDIFGRPIKIKDDDTDIGGTDIGQIDAGQIEQAQVLAPGLAGFIPLASDRQPDFDEESFPEGPQPNINVPEIDFSLPDIPSFDEIGGKITSKVEDIIDNPFSFNPEEGKLGTANILGKEIDIAETALSKAAQKGLTSLFGSKAFIATPFADLAIQGVLGEPITGKDVAFAVGKGIAGLAFGPIGVLAVAALQGLMSFFDEGPESPSAPSGGDPDPGGTAAATEGLGIDIGKDIDDFGDFGTTPDVGPSSGVSPGSPGFGGFGDTGDIGGPTGSGSMGGDEGDDGDDGADGDADACWVAGTQVLMGDCTYRNIEDLKIGDVVMSFPEDKKTRKWTTELEAKPIISLSVNRSRNIWHLNDTMVTGREWIVKGDGTAALVMWLQEGDTVMGADGEPIDIYRVEAAEGPLSSQITYTFETQNNFSYTADNFRTLRGRAVRAPEDWVYAKDVPTGSMQDEYNKKFNKLAA
tara:strand:+ start:458 stop:1951 length:1494 start_codon:yes stop_codon:yes gene_type:complete